ncbi:MAG: hypothetical protein WCK03_01235 [Candidatus Taylorbacteria bacterium]
MNIIYNVQLRTTGNGDSEPAKTAIKHPSKTLERGCILLKSGHRDCRFNAEPRMGQDGCGY